VRDRDEKDEGLSLLSRFLEDIPIDGKKVNALRNPRFFELTQPVVRRWGSIFMGKQITSSQILQLLCFEGAIEPPQALLYTLFLRLETVLSDPHPPSASIEQFKTLMRHRDGRKAQGEGRRRRVAAPASQGWNRRSGWRFRVPVTTEEEPPRR